MIGPEIRIWRRSSSAFRVCGAAGFASALVLAAALAHSRGLSLLVMGAIAAAAVSTFLLLALATKIVTAEEQLIYYHHEIAVMGAAALLLRLLDRPLLPYLDVTILCVGMFLACGRVGCMVAGCCYGRPSLWGIRYGNQHAEEGFPRYLVGIHLFPIQLIEAVTVLFIVISQTITVLRGAQPGVVLACYVTAYGLARFCFEFVRGDPDRRYLCGFSEAQWISGLLMFAVLWAEHKGLLPFQVWHYFVAFGVIGGAISVGICSRFAEASRYRLLRPSHVREIAAAMKSTPGVLVRVSRTSLGIQLSAGRIEIGDTWIGHYAFSRPAEPMTRHAARDLAQLILQLGRSSGTHELIEGPSNIYHLLVTKL